MVEYSFSTEKHFFHALCSIRNGSVEEKTGEIFKQMKYGRNLFTYHVLIWYAFEDMEECHEQPVIEWHTREFIGGKKATLNFVRKQNLCASSIRHICFDSYQLDANVPIRCAAERECGSLLSSLCFICLRNLHYVCVCVHSFSLFYSRIWIWISNANRNLHAQ